MTAERKTTSIRPPAKEPTTREQGGAQAKPSNTLSRGRTIEIEGGSAHPEESGQCLKAYIPKSWFHPIGIHKVLADLIPRLPDIRQGLFLTLTVDPKNYSGPEAAYEKSRPRLRKIFARLRRGIRWEGKLYKIDAPYAVKTEFHENGFAHYHVVFLTRRFLPASLLDHLWALGRTNIQRISNKEFKYLLKYVTKSGEIPEWVKLRKRIRIFQPSRGFLKPPKKKPPKKGPQQGTRRRRRTFSIGARLQNWERTALLAPIDPRPGSTFTTIILKKPFQELLDQQVHPVALDGRYLGNGKILIRNESELYEWTLNRNPN